LLPFTRPNLGDKLQRLGELSPALVNDVEHLVDLMLRRLETPESSQTDPSRSAEHT
jgi:hypothetical protein